MTFDTNTAITLAVLGFTGWNTYVSHKIKESVLEMEINLKREFNGKYSPISEIHVWERAIEHRLTQLEK